ncbi:unnamed protein product [Paramecium pentaurelia]|uniref:Uncharacterized protein n=1 Tax=Paramecium pentaurelia TaxID=43138 RepID=A0A8S1YJD0_9CILI|nr:unnamed protein product [Paramecium pentaurelia]
MTLIVRFFKQTMLQVMKLPEYKLQFQITKEYIDYLNPIINRYGAENYSTIKAQMYECDNLKLEMQILQKRAQYKVEKKMKNNIGKCDDILKSLKLICLISKII